MEGADTMERLQKLLGGFLADSEHPSQVPGRENLLMEFEMGEIVSNQNIQ
jgi:hypothetical protein